MLVVFGLALACPKGGGDEEPQVMGDQVLTPGESSGVSAWPYCRIQENYGPEAGRALFYQCTFRGEDPKWTWGAPTPPGLYECACGLEGADVPDAANCEDALQRACDIGPDTLPPKPCYEADFVEHICWPIRNDPSTWSCRCAPWEDPVHVPAATCGEAVTEHCQTCSSPRGECSRLPTQSNRDPMEFDCRCAEGAASHIGNEGFGDCGFALLQACGLPPVGERCETSYGVGRISCSADGQGDWMCDCPRFDVCYSKAHPIQPNCEFSDPSCVHLAEPLGGFRNPDECGEALYVYCECT